MSAAEKVSFLQASTSIQHAAGSVKLLPVDDSASLQVTKLLREHLLRDARQLATQLIESKWSGFQVMNDSNPPLAAKDLHRPLRPDSIAGASFAVSYSYLGVRRYPKGAFLPRTGTMHILWKLSTYTDTTEGMVTSRCCAIHSRIRNNQLESLCCK